MHVEPPTEPTTYHGKIEARLAPVSARRKLPRTFSVVFVAYVLARYKQVFTLDSPIFGWRPTEEVSIALGYLRNGFHFFYPQVFWGGNGPGYAEMEFPLVPFLNAILFKLFGVHELWCVVLSQLCGLGLVAVIYCFALRLGGEVAALVAGVVAAVVPPLTFMTTTGIWPDPPMVLFGAFGLYRMVRWVDQDRPADLWLAIASVSLAVLLKLTALCLGFPVLYLLLKRYGRSFWKAAPTWVAALGILVPPLLWYAHAHHLSVVYHNSFGIFSLGARKFGTAAELLDPTFYTVVAGKIFAYHLTPFGAVGLVIGLFASARNASQRLLLVWLASVALCTLVAATGVRIGHYQYLLPILPVGAIFAGIGWARVFDWVKAKLCFGNQRPLTAALASIGVLLLTSGAAWAQHRFEARDRAYSSPAWAKKKLTGQAVKKLTVPGSLLVVVDTEMDAQTPETAMTPPDVFYFADQKGWYLSLAWLRKERIEELCAEGARYLVVSGQSVADFKARADMFAWLSARYRKLLDGDEGIVFDLGGAPASADAR